MTELERALLHIKTRADAWAVKEIEKALSQEQTDIEQKTQEYEKAFMDGFESCSDLFTRNKEQQPCADAVSRDAVKEIICAEFVDTQDGMSEWRNAVNDVAENILHKAEQLPSVTQKYGKWILLDECANSGYYCSNCQKKLVKEGWSQTVKKIKYCPNCGARMESEE